MTGMFLFMKQVEHVVTLKDKSNTENLSVLFLLKVHYNVYNSVGGMIVPLNTANYDLLEHVDGFQK
jgi:hypothetical protein